MATNLITATELNERLGDPRLRVVDARFELGQPLAGKAQYDAGHLAGAVHLDLDEDLAAPARRGHGRHPLPDMADFARKLGSIGIDHDNEVVVYDRTGSMYAARAWWLLRYAGHRQVRFLDGGLEAYLAAGGRLTSEPTAPKPTTFELDLQEQLVINAAELKARLAEPGLTVLDARAPERYRGEVEPLDEKAGHIPTALNRPFAASIENGKLLPAARLAEVHGVAELAGSAEVVAYCGSGVSAAHLILAFEEAGLEGVKLYPGSWSEWSSLPGQPLASGPDPGDVDG